MNDKGIELLARRLDAIVKLMVFQMAENKPTRDKVWLLWTIGYEPREIADLLDISANNVRVTLSNLRKQRTKRKRSE